MSKKIYHVVYDDCIFSALVMADNEEDAIATLYDYECYPIEKEEFAEIVNFITEIPFDKSRVLP